MSETLLEQTVTTETLIMLCIKPELSHRLTITVCTNGNNELTENGYTLNPNLTILTRAKRPDNLLSESMDPPVRTLNSQQNIFVTKLSI